MRIVLVVTACWVILAGAACGGGDTGGGTGSGSSAQGGCSLLSAADIKNLVGSIPPKASPSGVGQIESCAWQISADHAVMILEIRPVDPALFENQTRSFKTVQVGGGEGRAGVSLQPSSGTRSGNLWALGSARMVNLTVTDSKLDEDTLVSRLAAAAEHVLSEVDK